MSSSPNEATHPCSIEACPDRPGRASYMEGESWGMCLRLSSLQTESSGAVAAAGDRTSWRQAGGRFTLTGHGVSQPPRPSAFGCGAGATKHQPQRHRPGHHALASFLTEGKHQTHERTSWRSPDHYSQSPSRGARGLTRSIAPHCKDRLDQLGNRALVMVGLRILEGGHEPVFVAQCDLRS
jgi:hypothetical protein